MNACRLSSALGHHRLSRLEYATVAYDPGDEDSFLDIIVDSMYIMYVNPHTPHFLSVPRRDSSKPYMLPRLEHPEDL